MADKEDLTVACCFWGDWCAPYGAQYVNKLYRATNKFLTIPHRFVCFTENMDENFDKGIEILPIELPSRVGEIGKLYFYKPNNGLTGRVLGMDLDTVIVKNINKFAKRTESFIVRGAFGNRKRDRTPRGGIGGDMVSFDAGFGSHIWEFFETNTAWVEAITEGDERVVYHTFLEQEDITFWQDLFADTYKSYKSDILTRGINIDKSKAVVISFHGKPRPHEVKDYCVRRYWHDL